MGRRWPHIQLRADPVAGGTLPPSGVEVVGAHVDDLELVRRDKEISGRRRPEDHAYWVRERGGVPLWFARRGQIIGYGFAQICSDDLLRHPDTITLGARTSDDAVAWVRAAVRWARKHSAVARISVTGPHPTLAALLAERFRIVEAETFCSTADEPFVDAQRYISSGASCSDLSLALRRTGGRPWQPTRPGRARPPAGAAARLPGQRATLGERRRRSAARRSR